MSEIGNLLEALKAKDKKALARCISIVENESNGYKQLVTELTFPSTTSIIGITGPPGAGKSTLINSILRSYTSRGDKEIAVLAFDPTSPYNQGAMLGDRIRMTVHHDDPKIFIRSIGSRGFLGGLSAKANEIINVMKASGPDHIFVETVGVGQSEVAVTEVADTTVVVLVPETGDEIQVMKSGLMEIADIFVVNKADRPMADNFVKDLTSLLHTHAQEGWKVPVIKTVATKNEGVEELLAKVEEHLSL